jgi:amidohydrolase
MNGTVRVFDDTVWAALPGQFERIVKGVAEAFGCQAEIDYHRHNKPTVNDAGMCRFARAAAVELVGENNVLDDVRTMGGEDFSYMLAEVPGVFIAVGSRNESRGLHYAHHHPRFDVDESCLELGVEVLLKTARKFLEA